MASYRGSTACISAATRSIGASSPSLPRACQLYHKLPQGHKRSLDCRRTLITAADPSHAALRGSLHVAPEISEAVASNKPVVALESTIYTHGAMGKDLAQEHEDLIRSHGGIPAIIAVLDGVATVGVSTKDIVRMIENEGTRKVSRRDVAYLVGMGLAGHKMHGGTTISGTMLLARLAGIRVFGTGGLGGVHKGGQDSMDISADLTELGRTRVAVISAGSKGFLDIPRTLEFLETQGALVSTFADGRSGNVDFPAFWARDSGIPSPSVVQTEKEAAAIILAQERLGIESGMLFANPIPKEAAIPREEINAAIAQAVAEADSRGFHGARNTPYVLGRLKELTGNKAYEANKVLVRHNLVRATKVAVELSRLLSPGSAASAASISVPTPSIGPVTQTSAPVEAEPELVVDTKTDVLVAGSVAIDLSCDYQSTRKGQVAPEPLTSNPASISQSIGGVGYNVALAAHLASKQARVKLCSLIGSDLTGSTVLTSLTASGMDTSLIRTTEGTANRTAQYVAVNDAEKNLVLAMADMAIFDNNPYPDLAKSVVEGSRPSWLVIDGNWADTDIKSWIRAGEQHDCSIAFEPVSMEKARRLFSRFRNTPPLRLFPTPSLHLSSPNIYELTAMYEQAREHGYFDVPEWFEIIDALGMRGARDRFVSLTSAELTDSGIPVQCVNLLPYIPTLVTKLGSKGALLTKLLSNDDPLLRDYDAAEYILARSPGDNSPVGGVYMRLFPATQVVKDVVSVNGVGDTFLGVLISGLAQGGRVENLIDVAQKGAVLSLGHAGSVSADLGSLESAISRVVRL